MKAFLLCLMLLAGSASAQTVGIHTFSIHEKSGFNNTNPGLYVRHDNGVTYGFFKNSYRRDSAYLAYTVETEEWKNFTLAMTVGGVSGYPAAQVMILAVPSITYHFGQSAVRIGIVPRPPRTGAASALHLMFETHI